MSEVCCCNQVDGLRSEMKQVRSANAHLQSERDEAEALIEQMREEEVSLIEQIAALKAEVEQLSSANAFLQSEGVEQRKRIADLEADKLSLQANVLGQKMCRAEAEAKLAKPPYGSLNADRWWQETAVNFTTEEVGGKGSVNLTTPVAEAFRDAYEIMRKLEAENAALRRCNDDLVIDNDKRYQRQQHLEAENAELAKRKPKFEVGDEVDVQTWNDGVVPSVVRQAYIVYQVEYKNKIPRFQYNVTEDKMTLSASKVTPVTAGDWYAAYLEWQRSTRPQVALLDYMYPMFERMSKQTEEAEVATLKPKHVVGLDGFDHAQVLGNCEFANRPSKDADLQAAVTDAIAGLQKVPEPEGKLKDVVLDDENVGRAALAFNVGELTGRLCLAIGQ